MNRLNEALDCRFLRAGLLAILGAFGATALASSAPLDLIPDRIFLDGAVYTQDPTHPWVEGFAIARGRYVAIGTSAEMRALAGPHTRVTDLAGRMVMSGLIDDHVHAVDGAMGELYDCIFPSSSSLEQIRKILGQCVRNAPAGTWIRGGYWESDFFKHFPLGSPRKWLDENAGNHPVIWRDESGHNAWVNSAALRLAGIDKNTADPTGGSFEREAGSSVPDGIALEAAAEVIQAAVPDRTGKEYYSSVMRAQELAHRFGIIGIKEADAVTPVIAAYQAADRQKQLSLYVATCISTLAHQSDPGSLLDYEAIDKIHATYHSDLVATNYVKIYLDGVPTPARTAAMLEPYLPDAKGNRVSGDLHVNPDVLARDVTELDRRGYTVKMHAAGDRAIRVGLDAIAAARQANPSSQLRHELAHAGLIAPEDIDRFAKLNAVAEFSPVIWYPSPVIDAVIEAIGERARHYWPMRSLLATGAPLAAGSDWPSVVPSMDPWAGIQAMVTRRDPYHPSENALWPEEAIGLADALRIYTLGGAAALRREVETGSIVVGKSADFVVLDHNLFKIPASQIRAAEVAMTYFRGRMVYERTATTRDNNKAETTQPPL
jgi:predicted amidohydrolase YtcJ